MPTALCPICETRRPRRYCPGIQKDICAPCCGREREVTISCPLDCPYLREARRHERLEPLDPDQLPHKDVRITEQFLEEHGELLRYSMRALLQAGLAEPNTYDSDVREALAALIRSYRTRQSGLLYDTRPENPLAARVQSLWQEALDTYTQERTQRTGMNSLRETDVLGILIFLERLALQENNGRPRARAFLDLLRRFVQEGDAQTEDSGSPLLLL